MATKKKATKKTAKKPAKRAAKKTAAKKPAKRAAKKTAKPKARRVRRPIDNQVSSLGPMNNEPFHGMLKPARSISHEELNEYLGGGRTK